MLRNQADISQVPSSGNFSELNAMLEGRQSMTHSPQYQQQSSRNGYGVSRSVLSPRANPSVMRSVSIDSETVLPMSQNNNLSMLLSITPLFQSWTWVSTILAMRDVPPLPHLLWPVILHCQHSTSLEMPLEKGGHYPWLR